MSNLQLPAESRDKRCQIFYLWQHIGTARIWKMGDIDERVKFLAVSREVHDKVEVFWLHAPDIETARIYSSPIVETRQLSGE